MNTNKICKYLIVFFLLFLPLASFAIDSINQQRSFFVDPSYDASSREKINATLVKISSRGYFYIETEFWNNQDAAEKDQITKSLGNLGIELDNKIYPGLTNSYGPIWSPGIDNDEKITVLIHSINSDSAGYFRESDEYSRAVLPKSNEREMVYLNADFINNPLLKGYLAHEFTHLINYNQKDRLNDLRDDVWLIEMRCDFAPAILGYNNIYKDSYLEKRVKKFLQNPVNSLTKWQDSLSDYANVTLLAQYISDQYGQDVIIATMKSKKIGYLSIEESLAKKGINKRFEEIFSDWIIANAVNDCFLGKEYCYKNINLVNLRVLPVTNFLPINSQSSLKVYDSLHDWSARWYKVVGGSEKLNFSFEGKKAVSYSVPYLLEKKDKTLTLKYLDLDFSKSGKIQIDNFDSQYLAFYFIPSIHDNSWIDNGGFEYNWTVSSSGTPQESSSTPNIDNQKQIAALQLQIAQLKTKLIEIIKQKIIQLQSQLYRIQHPI